MPGTSAKRVMAGTISRPLASRPITAGGPPPEANTRSKPGSSSPPARRKSATTLTTPRRIATSRISSAAQASIWSSLWSASRARYTFGSAESPVAATGPPTSFRAAVSMADRAPADAARAASREPSGQSLNRSVTQRPKRPGGATSGASATRAWRRRREPGGRLVHVLAGRTPGRPRWAPRPGTRPVLRTAASSSRGWRSARAGRPTGARRRRRPRSAAGAPTPGHGSGPRRRSRRRRRSRCTAPTRRVASSRSFLAGLYGIAAPVQVISRFRPPTLMSSSFGPKNHSRGRNGRTAISTNGSAQLMWLKQ